jgi:hypothetical protein
VRQARREQRAGVEARCADALSEPFEEHVGILVRVAADLAAQEAVLRRQVALDVHEAGDPPGVAVGEQQRGQAAHGVSDEDAPLDPSRT